MSHHRLHEYSELLSEGESKGIAMVCTVAVMVCALLAALVAQSQVNTDFLLRERIECDRRVHHAELQARRARDDARGLFITIILPLVPQSS